jgi:hypothetical protein
MAPQLPRRRLDNRLTSKLRPFSANKKPRQQYWLSGEECIGQGAGFVLTSCSKSRYTHSPLKTNCRLIIANRASEPIAHGNLTGCHNPENGITTDTETDARSFTAIRFHAHPPGLDAQENTIVRRHLTVRRRIPLPRQQSQLRRWCERWEPARARG